MKSDGTPLDAIPEESFDGDHQSTELKFERCLHKKVSFVNGELRCPCGNCWSGPNLQELYKLLHKE